MERETIELRISVSIPLENYEDAYEYLAYARKVIADKLHDKMSADVESFLD